MKKILAFFLLSFLLFNIGNTNAYNFNNNEGKRVYIENNLKNKLDYILVKFFVKFDKKFKDIEKRISFYENLNNFLEKKKNKKNEKLIDYFIYSIKNKINKLKNLKKDEKNDSFENSFFNLIEKEKENNFIKPEKNNIFKSFSQVKRVLQGIYIRKELPSKTVYCNASFNPKTKYVDLINTDYKNNGKYITRSKKIEWEHIVPAENFGKSFLSWREPYKFSQCKKKKGGYYSSRTCAEKVSSEFRQMESDAYNLYPAIGALNALRSNYQIAEIPGEKREFGRCDFEISNRKVEPPQNMKGDIARVYMYMNITYPGKGIIGEKNKKLIEYWDKIDPVSKEECKRYEIIKKVQKNVNAILEKRCKEVK